MPPMDAITIRGVRLELQHIPGPAHLAPLVFLHEGLGSVSAWGRGVHAWPRQLCAATGRAGWLYSRRGFGQSDPTPDFRGPSRDEGGWPVGRRRADYLHHDAWVVLPELLRQLGVRAPVLIGHSDGASIALLHAARHEVTACVAMAPHVFIEDMTVRAIEQARAAYADTLRPKLARHHRDPDNAFWPWADIWLDPAFRDFDIQAECRDIRCPLLLVQGEDDEYASMAQLHAIARAAPQAREWALPHCGHSPHRDQPGPLTAGIAQWLATLSPGPGERA